MRIYFAMCNIPMYKLISRVIRGISNETKTCSISWKQLLTFHKFLTLNTLHAFYSKILNMVSLNRATNQKGGILKSVSQTNEKRKQANEIKGIWNQLNTLLRLNVTQARRRERMWPEYYKCIHERQREQVLSNKWV